MKGGSLAVLTICQGHLQKVGDKGNHDQRKVLADKVVFKYQQASKCSSKRELVAQGIQLGTPGTADLQGSRQTAIDRVCCIADKQEPGKQAPFLQDNKEKEQWNCQHTVE